jgi:predicted  nucleic acid-binding Zn-ribbon protein
MITTSETEMEDAQDQKRSLEATVAALAVQLRELSARQRALSARHRSLKQDLATKRREEALRAGV